MINNIKRVWLKSSSVKSLVIILSSILITGILMLLSSNAVGNITDLITKKSTDSVYKMLLVFLLVEISILVIDFLKDNYQSKVIEEMHVNLKEFTIKSLLESKYEYSVKHEKGDLIGRLNSDISSLVTASTMSIQVLKSIILTSILSIGILIIDYRLLILFIIPIIVMIAIQYFVGKFTTSLILPWKVAMGESNALSQDIISNRSTIKIFSIYKQIRIYLNEALQNSRNKGIKGIFTLYLVQTPLIILIIMPTINVLIGGIYLVFTDSISVANFMSVFLISTLVIEQIQPLINGAQNIPHLLTSVERIFPIWDAEKEVFLDQVGSGDPLIKIDDLHFSYDSNKILDGINLEINKGELIGFVGESGSGKSTLFNIINGLYTPDKGQVLVKNVSVQLWDKVSFRKLFSVVAQNTYLLNKSIKDNLLSVNKSASDSEMQTVLENVFLLKNLDTEVGENGSNLSGGERQRLSIARALLNNSEILLFDEATSALDTKTEQVISDLISNNSKFQTRLMIAHRISSLVNCDRIYFLKNGKITECGSHTQLMMQKQDYYNLVNAQKGDKLNEEK